MSQIQIVRDAFAAVRTASDLSNAKRLAAKLNRIDLHAVTGSWVAACRRVYGQAGA